MPYDMEDSEADAVITDRISRVLAQITESDFERVDPPPGLWEQIEASVRANEFLSPREPPVRGVSVPLVVEYRIGADDIVTEVGQGWAKFAQENDASELADLRSERALWTYFDNEETRQVWQLVVGRVRALQKTAHVPFRCDAPSVRRWFEMAITPEAHGRVHFQSVLVFEEPRPTVALLDPLRERDYDLRPVAVCSWCGRGQLDSRWLDIEELVRAARLLERSSLPPIAHGICASCRDEMSAEIVVPSGAESPA